MKGIALWIVSKVGSLGYAGIFFLMFLESSFFPFPSEVVMPPAGYLAAKGKMNLWLAIFAGSAGSLAGALFNYYLAMLLGRPFLERYGRYLLVDRKKLAWLDGFFERHGAISTFVGRLLPGIRQYISLPAGLSRMNVLVFSIFTFAGAGIWVSTLALIGYFVGKNEVLLKRYIHLATLGALVFSALLIALYIKLKKNLLDAGAKA